MGRWHFHRLDAAAAAEPFRAMTFPRFRSRLRELGPESPVAAVGLTEAAEATEAIPVGLALAVCGTEDGRAADLLSLYVNPNYRGRGLGRRLLTAMEDQLEQRGMHRLNTVYMTRLPHLEAYEAVLRANGWSEPRRRMYVFRTDRDHLEQAEWFHFFETPPAGVSIVPWTEISVEAREELRQAIASPASVLPQDVNPFLFEGVGIDGSPQEPALSFGCVRGNEIIGWHLAHRIGSDAVRFSCSFIRPDLQEQLPLLTLWRHAFQQLGRHGYVHVSWAIAPHHEEMLRFNEHLLAPHVLDFDETRGATKQLGSG